jgi:hypothetical protein
MTDMTKLAVLENLQRRLKCGRDRRLRRGNKKEAMKT